MAAANNVKYTSPVTVKAVRGMKTREHTTLTMTGANSDHQSRACVLAGAPAVEGDATRDLLKASAFLFTERPFSDIPPRSRSRQPTRQLPRLHGAHPTHVSFLSRRTHPGRQDKH